MASNVLKGITVKIRGNTTDLQAKLSSLTKSTRTLGTQLNDVDRALKLDPSNVELLGQKQRYASQQAEVLRERIDAITAGLSQTKVGTEAYDRLNRELVKARSNLDKAERTARDATEQIEGVGTKGFAAISRNAEESAARVEALGRAATSVGSALTMGVTVPLAAAAVASTNMAIQYEDAFAGVRKTVDATDSELAALYDSTVALSEVQPVSATDLMQIEALGGQLGIANENLLDFAQVVAGMDIATDLGAEDAATEMAQFANIVGMSQDDMSRLASTVVALGNNTATTESSIMAMAMRIAGAGAAAGLSEADILGLSAALSSVGIEAEAGGSAISTIISNIDKSVATGSASLDVWASTARMSAAEFSAAWSEDPVAALQAVISGMGQGVDEGGNLALMLEELGITELRQTDTMKRLTGAGDLLNDTIAIANDGWRQNTALQTEVSARNGTTSAKLSILKNRVSNAAAELGGPLADALVKVIDSLEPVIDGAKDAAEWFAGLDDGSRDLVLGLAGVAAAIGPVTSAAGHMISGVSEAKDILGKLTDASRNSPSALAEAGDAIEGIGTKAGNAAGMAGGLKEALVLLGAAAVIGAIALVVSKLSEMEEQERRVEDAAGGIRGALEDMGGADTSLAASGIESVNEQAEKLLKTVQDSADETIKLYQELAQDNFTMEQQVSEVERLAEEISDLSSEEDLTESQQRALSDAVDEFNAITGASISVVSSQTGELSANADAIDEIVEAYKRQARAAAYQDALAQVYERQAAALMNVQGAQELVEQATKNLEAAQRDLADAEADPYLMSSPELYGQLRDSVDSATIAFDNASAALETATAEYMGASDSVRVYEDALEAQAEQSVDAAQADDARAESASGATEATEDATEATEDYALATGESVKVTKQQSKALDEAASHVSDVAKAMEDMGSAVGRYVREAGYGVTQFGLLVESTGGSVERMSSVLSTLQAASDPFESLSASLAWTAGNAAAADAGLGTLARTTYDIAANIAADQATVDAFNQVVADLYAQCETQADIAFVNSLVEKGPAALGELQNIAGTYEDANVSIHDLANAQARLDESIASTAVNAELERMSASFRVLGTSALDTAWQVDEATGNVVALVGEGADEMVVAFDAATGEVVRAISSSEPEVATAAERLRLAAAEGVAGVASDMSAAGESASESFSEGMESGSDEAADSGSVLGDASYEALVTLPDEMEARGKVAGASLAGGIEAQWGYVSAAASSLVDAARTALGNLDWAYDSGSELGSNFASGIVSASGDVALAAGGLAYSASEYLHHSTPDKGPLKGDDLWGREMGLNFAATLASTVGEVARASASVAEAASLRVQAAQPSVGLTKTDVYDAFSAAMAANRGRQAEVGVYVDGRKLAGALSRRMDQELGRMESRSSR